MRHTAFFACLVALAHWGSTAALSELPLPEPEEDATKLRKPTLSSAVSNGKEILLMDWDGTNKRLWMTNENAFTYNEEWAPDGRRAAFVVFDTFEYRPYVIDLRTNRVQNLLEWLPPARGSYNLPSWSRDGRWITIVDRWHVNNLVVHSILYKVNVVTGEAVPLTHHPELYPVWAEWSPDGGKIAFTAQDEPRVLDMEGNANYAVRSLYMMDSDGSNVVKITNLPRSVEWLSWSPDGKKIVFAAYHEVPFELGGEVYMINPDGSDLERITFNTHTEGKMNWTPDSNWLVFLTVPRAEGDETPKSLHHLHVPTREIRFTTPFPHLGDVRWVWAGKSRFLSVDPDVKKKESWGALKKTMESETRKP